MKKIIVQEFITLNGFIEDANDKDMKWVTNIFNEEMVKEIADWSKNVDTIMLGRTTFEILSAYWPTSWAKERDPVMYAHMNNAAKIVFSKTLNDPKWNNTTIMRDINYDAIQQLKNSGGRNIAISGSASIVQSLMNLDLVDELHLMVHPLAVGNGKSLFANLNERRNFNLRNSKLFKNGVIVLYYERK
ncbi:MAG: dihydrofolate reductase [Bacteroidetes bacterium]|nr:dihydrofolate reductase [Bacteroidota bacterium]